LAPAARTNWTVVGLAVGAGVLAAFQVGKVPVALPGLRNDLALTLVAAGWVISMFNLISAVGGAPMGAVAGRFGDRRVILWGLLLLGASSGGGAFATDDLTILVSRFFEGLGALMIQVAAPALIQRYALPADQRLAFGLWGSWMGTGQFIIMVSSPLLLPALGWRGLWIANAVLLIAFSVWVAIATRAPDVVPRPPQQRRDLWRDLRDTLAAPGPLTLALCFSTYALNYLALVGFLPTFFIEEVHLSASTAALLTAAGVIINAVANVMGGVLMSRGFARWQLIVASHLIMGATSVGIFWPGLPFEIRYPLVLLFMTGGILPASVFSGAVRHSPAPHLAPITNGVIVQGAAVGQFIGPPAVAALAHAVGGWQLSPLVLAGGAAFGIALALYLRRLETER
jgi:predicted MFS family arabinose efflux permease